MKSDKFATSERKANLKNAAEGEARIEKDVLGTLLAEGNKTGTVIDTDKALKYLFSPVCAPLCNPDGSRRKTKKSDLFSVLDDMEIDISDAHEKRKTYMVDLATYVRSVIKNCTTVWDIADKLLASIPSRYDTVYVVCDTYLEGSIKSAEWQTRGNGSRCILKNLDMKVPYDIAFFCL